MGIADSKVVHTAKKDRKGGMVTMWITSENTTLIKLLQSALLIEKPWELTVMAYDEEQEQWNLYLDFPRGAEFPCPTCGTPSKAYDVSSKSWRHLDFWEWKTYVHARVPRVTCRQCHKVITVHVSWSRPSSHFTWHFESYAMRLMSEMPVKAASRELREHDTRLWRIFRHYVERAMEELDLSNVKRVAIDETSSRKGHQYITLFVDADRKLVLFAVEGKGSETIHRFREHLSSNGVDADQIAEMCCDMSPAFIRGIQDAFPHAQITFDKFHVMKMVNEAVDDVRKEEQKQTPELHKTKYIWLKNEDMLTNDQKKTLERLKDGNLKTGRAYRMKLALQDLWQVNQLFADIFLDEWLGWATRSQLPPFIRVSKTIKKHKEGILRWFTTRMTNGLLEGLNSLIQAAKRRARGYRNPQNLIHMVYMTANKLYIRACASRQA
ncbi:ISL3 family transposase [Numidum massiliense]|uniref:ISL3 family transposase n=1 Tax=Numidum massiliense TaxID=1522315 RepID=UPI001E283DFA|nr:ISL3 family transposase [Numidum massiliense]